MPNVDQFESVFRAADKPSYAYARPAIQRVLLLSDQTGPEAATFHEAAKRFLAVLGDSEFMTPEAEASQTVDTLLATVDAAGPDLICTYRNLHATPWPHTLGKHLDVLTQAVDVPVLVLPRPDEDAFQRTTVQTQTVMAMTDHLAGADALVNMAARFTAPQGTLWLSHVEDAVVFDRYIDLISKLPDFDTDHLKAQLQARLMQEPHDYVTRCAGGIREAGLSITPRELVQMGGRLETYQQMVAEHDVDLLVMNTKDQDQLAMHGMAYPLAVELRQTPMLML